MTPPDTRTAENFRELLSLFETATNTENVGAVLELVEPLARAVSNAFEFHKFVVELDTASLLLDIDQGLAMNDFIVFLSEQLRSDFMSGAFSDESGVRWSELALTLYRATMKRR